MSHWPSRSASAVIASSELTCHGYREHFVRRREQAGRGSRARGHVAGRGRDRLGAVHRPRGPDVAGQRPTAAGARRPARRKRDSRHCLRHRGRCASTARTRRGQPAAGGPIGTASAPGERGPAFRRPGVDAAADPDELAGPGSGPGGHAGRDAEGGGGGGGERGARGVARGERRERGEPAGNAGNAEEGLARGLRSCAESLRQAAGHLLWEGGCHPVLLRAGAQPGRCAR